MTASIQSTYETVNRKQHIFSSSCQLSKKKQSCRSQFKVQRCLLNHCALNIFNENKWISGKLQFVCSILQEYTCNMDWDNAVNGLFPSFMIHVFTQAVVCRFRGFPWFPLNFFCLQFSLPTFSSFPVSSTAEHWKSLWAYSVVKIQLHPRDRGFP